MNRESLKRLTDIPNIGKAMERDFQHIGIHRPADLIGCDPYQLYQRLCEITQVRQDPCVLDTFMAAVDFMAGGTPKKWWEFTAERKRKYGQG
ncbi:MAG: helix-hairpin-helix domain-containing protein [Gammaproteobacteria bacterium]|nr:helix-hairpin-helix domain-containing protein [Gammaproteobacteria bacterium]